MSIAGFLTQTVYLASATGKDNYGKQTYETPRAVVARVEGQRRLVRKSTGDEAVANHRIYTLAPVLLTDRIWIPGADSAQLEQSALPLTVESSGDKTNSRTLYRTDL